MGVDVSLRHEVHPQTVFLRLSLSRNNTLSTIQFRPATMSFVAVSIITNNQRLRQRCRLCSDTLAVKAKTVCMTYYGQSYSSTHHHPGPEDAGAGGQVAWPARSTSHSASLSSFSSSTHRSLPLESTKLLPLSAMRSVGR